MPCTAVRYFECKCYSWSAGYGNEWFLGDDRRVSEAGVGSSLQFCTTSASVQRGLLLFDLGGVSESVPECADYPLIMCEWSASDRFEKRPGISSQD
jgi:hypothetical protein